LPPRSYIITAIVLTALVGVSFPLTLGFSIILWYWLFAGAACLLAVVGVFKIANGLRAPSWIGIALASPGLVWAATSLREITSSMPSPAIFTAFNVAAYLALLAAAAGALKLAETMSGSHAAFRLGYWILAAAAVTVGVSVFAHTMGWIFTTNALYAASAKALAVAAALVKYGAFVGVSVLITIHRDIERWVAVAIGVVGAYMLYMALRSLFFVDLPGDGEGLVFWLQPVLMLIGAAAVWRMGSVLRAQAIRAQPVQS
jgi:hypothetical protein